MVGESLDSQNKYFLNSQESNDQLFKTIVNELQMNCFFKLVKNFFACVNLVYF